MCLVWLKKEVILPVSNEEEGSLTKNQAISHVILEVLWIKKSEKSGILGNF